MKADVSELLFPSRAEFREWLCENNESSGGVWLVFGKTGTVVSLSAVDALEEALCFGWIDGQMKSVDDDRYLKYFARRRAKSVWSDKNKKLVDNLRERGLMTTPGEKAVDIAKQNNTWDAPKTDPVTDEQINALAAKLSGISPAYENFANMPRSVRLTYTRRYLSFKSEDARERDFAKIVDRLNNNLRPM